MYQLTKRFLGLLLCVCTIILTGNHLSVTAKAADIPLFTSPIDYSKADNWLYDGAYPENEVDVFMVAPTVDTQSFCNAQLTDGYKKIFRYAMNQQQALYAETAKIYAPYYRQASINAYSMNLTDREKALSNAYMDVSAAFKYYIENQNNGRPFLLAGFSQGADMCYRLLEEFFGNEYEGSAELRENLIGVYAIGWSLTQDMVDKYPQIVPATGEFDTGVVISFDCEDGTVTDSFITPAGTKAISINPLNWKTDSTKADRSLNIGTVVQDSKTGAVLSVEAAKCGAYIDPNRGTLIVTDIDTADYPKVLNVFPDGSLHLYDNFLFYANLQQNIKDRTNAYLAQRKADAA